MTNKDLQRFQSSSSLDRSNSELINPILAHIPIDEIVTEILQGALKSRYMEMDFDAWVAYLRRGVLDGEKLYGSISTGCKGCEFRANKEAIANGNKCGFTASTQTGGLQVFALLFDMNLLFEAYVTQILTRQLRPLGIQVQTQKGKQFWRYKQLRPDILLHYPNGRCVVLDSKWKLPRDGAPADADLKQMFAYNEQFGAEESWLVYPFQEGAAQQKALFKHKSHACGLAFLKLFETSGKPYDAIDFNFLFKERAF